MQWDEGASVLFQDPGVFDKLTRGMVNAAGLQQPVWPGSFKTSSSSSVMDSVVTDAIKDCLLLTAENGQAPDACLVDLYVGQGMNKKKEDYFLYEEASSSSSGGTSESSFVDACEVYTGPSDSLPYPNDFQKCLVNDLIEENNCNIPSFVWSGRSTGKTPVASYHSWTESSTITKNVDEMNNKAKQQFSVISSYVRDIIKAVNDSFVSKPITAELFSAEGDALHQLMDCMYMGPFARLDYYTPNVSSSLPVPGWSRMDAWSQSEVSFSLVL